MAMVRVHCAVHGGVTVRSCLRSCRASENDKRVVRHRLRHQMANASFRFDFIAAYIYLLKKKGLREA